MYSMQPHSLQLQQQHKQRSFVGHDHNANKAANTAQPAKLATKDDAYMQFMREMQGLL